MASSKYGNSSRPPECGAGSPVGVVWTALEPVFDDPLPTDPRPVPHPPDAAIASWGELRELLLGHWVPTEARDAIWRWLIERARCHGPDATLACASLAAPMLGRIAGRFASPHSPHRHDVESEVLLGFLTQLRNIELDRPLLWSRLRWAALTSGWEWAQKRAVLAPVDEPGDWGDLGRLMSPHGHPDLVLADAVAEGVITADAAELIALTRWERRSMGAVAEKLRGAKSHWTIRKQRQRAENALVPWLAARIAASPPGPASGTHAGTPARSTGHQRPSASSPAQPAPAPTTQEARRCA